MTIIGYAGLAAYKKEMQAAYNYVALVDCGDSVQGDVYRHAVHRANIWSIS